MPKTFASRKVKTLFHVLKGGGAKAAWSLLNRRLVEVSRAMPGGLMRVGTCFFRCPDEESRTLILEGIYEAPELFAVQSFVRRDLPVVEFGGSLGVVACLLNQRLRKPQNHVVVEADPELISILSENRNRNHCRFEIIHGAGGASGSPARIYLSSGTLCASLNLTGDRFVDVPAITLSNILQEKGFGRCALVCDIEGAESRLIRDELETLQSRVETMIVEFHPKITGPDDVENSRRLLAERGFQQVWTGLDTQVFQNAALN